MIQVNCADHKSRVWPERSRRPAHCGGIDGKRRSIIRIT
jgi:hypothetical protein